MSRAIQEALGWVHLTGWYPAGCHTRVQAAISTRVTFTSTGAPGSLPGHSLLPGETAHLRSRTLARARFLRVLGFSPQLGPWSAVSYTHLRAHET